MKTYATMDLLHAAIRQTANENEDVQRLRWWVGIHQLVKSGKLATPQDYRVDQGELVLLSHRVLLAMLPVMEKWPPLMRTRAIVPDSFLAEDVSFMGIGPEQRALRFDLKKLPKDLLPKATSGRTKP